MYWPEPSYVTKELPMYWQRAGKLEKGIFFGTTISWWDNIKSWMNFTGYNWESNIH
jgi:hypothetical protein